MASRNIITRELVIVLKVISRPHYLTAFQNILTLCALTNSSMKYEIVFGTRRTVSI